MQSLIKHRPLPQTSPFFPSQRRARRDRSGFQTVPRETNTRDRGPRRPRVRRYPQGPSGSPSPPPRPAPPPPPSPRTSPPSGAGPRSPQWVFIYRWGGGEDVPALHPPPAGIGTPTPWAGEGGGAPQSISTHKTLQLGLGSGTQSRPTGCYIASRFLPSSHQGVGEVGVVSGCV